LKFSVIHHTHETDEVSTPLKMQVSATQHSAEHSRTEGGTISERLAVNGLSAGAVARRKVALSPPQHNTTHITQHTTPDVCR
jgi:hypothetical protein